MIRMIKPHHFLHVMLRVSDLTRSLEFYQNIMGLTLVRRKDYQEGRFTLAFLGYGPECETTVLELTHNWDETSYEIGSAYGHMALAVQNIYDFCTALADIGVRITRQPGPMTFDDTEIIAFIKDPDGYTIELIEKQ